jgi:hypothetical protein
MLEMSGSPERILMYRFMCNSERGRVVRYFWVIWLVLAVANPAVAQSGVSAPADTADLNIKAFADNIVGHTQGNYEKAAKVLNWLSSNFHWLATDYQTRTVKEIIVRRGGNCFELAITYMALIDELGINYRAIAEINLSQASDEREKDAEALVRKSGYRASVFGKRHNDHRWVEVFDDRSGEWIPVDPTMGLIGIDQWEKARAWFGRRHTLNDEFSHSMIAPIAIFVVDPAHKTEMGTDRTAYYMEEELNRLYKNRLEKLPSWPAWVRGLVEIDKHARAAFAGKENLHDYTGQIAGLLATYWRLKREYRKQFGG